MGSSWKRAGALLALLVFVASAPAPGCTLDRAGQRNGFAGAGGHASGPCDTAADCEEAPSCQTAHCTNGACELLVDPLGAPCGVSGDRKCDGKGVCVECLGPGDCLPGDCADGVKLGGERCELGVCVTNDTVTCSPYACNAAGDNCLADCTQGGINDCVDDNLCNQDGQCVASFDIGHPCAPGQCTSGFCVDGVCCDGACDGPCDKCVQSETGLSDGVCGFAPAFTDPNDACVEAIGCDETGSCATCGFSASAPGDVLCPTQCTSCSTTAPFVCDIVCDTAVSTCENLMLTCPAGWDCNVTCVDATACLDTVVECPLDHRCDVSCADATQACAGMTVNCSDTGPCAIDCQGGNTCLGSTMECQNNACTGACDGTADPTFVANGMSCREGCQ